jgi:hypothetical protein
VDNLTGKPIQVVNDHGINLARLNQVPNPIQARAVEDRTTHTVIADFGYH